MAYKVIDNFLDEESFRDIQDFLMGHDCDWHYSKVTTDEDPDEDFQFIHVFYQAMEPSDTFARLEPLLKKMKIYLMIRAKANLLTKTNVIREYGFHIDSAYDNVTSAVFYINTCNGYTLFEDGTKIESIANRILIFDAFHKHTGSSCTDENRRVVINLNYFKG